MGKVREGERREHYLATALRILLGQLALEIMASSQILCRSLPLRLPVKFWRVTVADGNVEAPVFGTQWCTLMQCADPGLLPPPQPALFAWQHGVEWHLLSPSCSSLGSVYDVPPPPPLLPPLLPACLGPALPQVHGDALPVAVVWISSSLVSSSLMGAAGAMGAAAKLLVVVAAARPAAKLLVLVAGAMGAAAREGARLLVLVPGAMGAAARKGARLRGIHLDVEGLDEY